MTTKCAHEDRNDHIELSQERGGNRREQHVSRLARQLGTADASLAVIMCKDTLENRWIEDNEEVGKALRRDLADTRAMLRDSRGGNDPDIQKLVANIKKVEEYLNGEADYPSKAIRDARSTLADLLGLDAHPDPRSHKDSDTLASIATSITLVDWLGSRSESGLNSDAREEINDQLGETKDTLGDYSGRCCSRARSALADIIGQVKRTGCVKSDVCYAVDALEEAYEVIRRDET